MAETWIKVRTQLSQLGEIRRLAKILNVPRAHVLGLVVIFWGWADGECEDGIIPAIDGDEIDSIVEHPGFAKALEKVGWLNFDDVGVVIPRFERHMGHSTKRRACAARRQEVWRAKSVRSGVIDDQGR